MKEMERSEREMSVDNLRLEANKKPLSFCERKINENEVCVSR
jgi:hypothetical protein